MGNKALGVLFIIAAILSLAGIILGAWSLMHPHVCIPGLY